jgi:hypothetical protein
MWAECDDFGNVQQLHEPLSLVGIEREADFKLVFVKEVSSEESLSKKKLYFSQDVHVQINDNVSSDIVLRWESGSKKWFLSHLTMLGQTIVCPLESDSCITVIKSEPYRLKSATEAKEILKTNGWGFGKIEQKSDGSLDYYVTV